MPYKVIVADNFHYRDESESYELGTFATLELAIEASKRIVDGCLTTAYKPGMSAAELYRSYTAFGDDPYIVAAETGAVLFSGWKYAREQCEVLCEEKNEASRNGA